MKNILLTSLIATSLIACGGDDDSSSSKTAAKIDPSLIAQLPTELKGSITEPELSSTTVTESDALTVNSKSTGTVLAGSSIDLNFTTDESGPLLAILSSSARDLDFDIYDNTNSVYLGDSSNGSSDEVIFFNAVAGSQYTISVYETFDEDATFELKLVEANRASLGLSDNEYAVHAQETMNESCVEIVNGGSPNTTSDSDLEGDLSIFNWKDGYVRSYGDSEQYSFTSVNGNKVTLKFNDSETDTYNNVTYSYTYQGTFNFTTDFKTGTFTGTGSNSSSESSSDTSYSEECTGTSSSTGKIVL